MASTPEERAERAAYMRAYAARKKAEVIAAGLPITTPQQCSKCKAHLTHADFVPARRGIPGSKCRACMLANNKDWAMRNPEKRAAQRKRWLDGAMTRDPEATRSKAAARMRTYRANHPGVAEARTKVWYAANPDKVKALAKASYAKNPEAYKQWRDLRRARIKGGTVDGPVDRQAIIARDGGRCHLCGGYPTGRDLTLDHVVPLARGGAHAEENLRVACRSCNSRKSARVPGP